MRSEMMSQQGKSMRTEFDNMNKHDTFMTNDNIPITSTEAEVVLYQPDENIKLDVRIEDETVWLSQMQMAELFATTKQNISLHIGNIFREGELQQEVVVKDSFTTTPHGAINGKTQRKKLKLYNLDVIISVGYRVKSQRGTQFRIWATGILKQYLLQGYAVNQQLLAIQRQIDTRFDEHAHRMMQIEDTQAKQQQQLDFFIRTSTPPAEMVFFEGDFYTARAALEALVKTATTRVIIIDGYVSSLTLSILDVRQPGVQAIIYTVGVGQGMTNLMQEHDRLFPSAHIDIRKWRNESHDRWLIIDDTLYHCGHSLNANGGHKISAITRMQMSPDIILSQMQ